MFEHAGHGYAGSGTLCGSLGVSSCLINLVLHDDHYGYMAVIDHLMKWYSGMQFPTTRFDHLSKFPNQVQEQAMTPLCHTSVSKWALNRAEGITLKKCLELFDINNKFIPVFDEDDTLDLQCDHIILAVGQKSDTSYVESAVVLDAGGRIQTGKRQDTSLEGVYVAGDICRPGNAINAIAQGRKAAEEIDSYLGGIGLFTGDEIEVPVFQSHYSIWDTKGQTETVGLFSKGCNDAFEEGRGIFIQEQARSEALRCMRCDRNSRQ